MLSIGRSGDEMNAESKQTRPFLGEIALLQSIIFCEFQMVCQSFGHTSEHVICYNTVCVPFFFLWGMPKRFKISKCFDLTTIRLIQIWRHIINEKTDQVSWKHPQRQQWRSCRGSYGRSPRRSCDTWSDWWLSGEWLWPTRESCSNGWRRRSCRCTECRH